MTFRRRDVITERRRQQRQRPQARTAAAAVAGDAHRRPEATQLAMLDGMARSYRFGRFDLRRQAATENPTLRQALALARRLAQTHGWSDTVLATLNRNLIMLLSEHRAGEQIRYSDYADTLRARSAALRRTTDVLASLGVLLDDRMPTFSSWLQARLADLAPDIATDVEQWALALHGGRGRMRARTEKSVTNYVTAVHPTLVAWSREHAHLREISRVQVLAVTANLRGRHRQAMLIALRCLFGWAKASGIVFTNPTTGIRVGRLPRPVLQPLPPEHLALSITAGTTLQAKVFIVLAAVHAARPGAVRTLQLSNVDLGNRRLCIAGRDRPLDNLTYRILRRWLDHRRRRWPHTANPHVLISVASALGTAPVSQPWVDRELRGLPATLDRIRMDRHLEEALVHGPDPLHIAEVFDVDPSTAIHYASSARQLLADPTNAGASGSTRTPTPLPSDPLDPPSGSP
jgi:hypothetical protein